MKTRIKIRYPIDAEDAVNILNLSKEEYTIFFEARCVLGNNHNKGDKNWRPYYEVTDLQLQLLKRAKISVIYY